MSTLSEVLATWLPTQRWYAGKGLAVDGVQVESLDTLTADDGVTAFDAVVAVSTGGAGEAVRYQVPLTLHADQQEDLAHAEVGQLDEPDHVGWLYDGLLDPAGSSAWLRRLAAGGTAGSLTFTAREEVDATEPGRPVGAEQSNTSVIYGDAGILKVFRRLAPGVNPDLEVTLALAEAGSPHVAAPRGWVEGTVDGQPTTLAFLQQFLRDGSDGWRLATASVRDLLAEGDLGADEVGGDFAAESERLGQATAEVHALLARVLPTEVVGEQDNRATAAQMRERLDRAAAEVDALAPYLDALRATYDEVAALTDTVTVQRVHGDYHLGQVLRTQAGWTLLDFEGEPARPLSERTALMSPMRDVAGMLRSFDYAARSLLADHLGEQGMEYHAAEWAERNRSAFCDGYAAASGRDPREDDVRLRAFELDKAVYEVVYEARHRPAWLSIPLGSVERLTAAA